MTHAPDTGKSLIPASLGGVDHVRRDVLDVLVGETAAERRHGVLAVGDLSVNATIGVV